MKAQDTVRESYRAQYTSAMLGKKGAANMSCLIKEGPQLQKDHNDSVKFFKHFKEKSMPRKESLRKILIK